jgi:hypothetical protein
MLDVILSVAVELVVSVTASIFEHNLSFRSPASAGNSHNNSETEKSEIEKDGIEKDEKEKPETNTGSHIQSAE